MNRENIVKGKKYRILRDAVNKVWDRISFWTDASDVQLDDNTTLADYYSTNKTQVLSEKDWNELLAKEVTEPGKHIDPTTFYYVTKGET